MNLLEYLGLEQKLSPEDLERVAFMRQLNLDKAGVALVTGLQRSGKTTWGISLSWMRRKYFGYPVVSNVLLKPEFGEYTYLDTEVLVAQMKKVNVLVEKAVERQENARQRNDRGRRAAEEVWRGTDVKLRRSTIIIDEGYGAFERRRGMSPKLLLYSYLVQQWGHYESLIIVISSTEKLLDSNRLSPFATHEVTCSHVKEWGLSLYRVFDRQQEVEDGANPLSQTIYVPNWSGLFDTHAPVAVPKDMLRSALKAEGL